MLCHECFNSLQDKAPLRVDILLLKFPDRHMTQWWIAPSGYLTGCLTGMQRIDNAIKHGMIVE